MVGSVADMAGEDARTRVFLSYSRRDAALVARIAEGLMAAGFLADFDQAAHDPDNVSAGISAEDEWWKRLQEMIAAADVMVFLVSPDSATSAVCDEEIAYARALGKRIIAVLAREVDFAKAPPRLSALNVRIDFSDGGPGFDAALTGLTRALEMNVGWHRDGRKYYARVQEWDTGGRPKSRLLREGAVEEAERWALARPRNEPEPGELFLAWIAASRAQIKRDAAVRAFWRRVTAVFVVTTLVATIAGAWFVINGQRNLGRSESLMLARTSDQFYNEGDYVRALHLAILASRDSFLAPSTDEAKAAFARSAQALTHLVSVRQEMREGEKGDPAIQKQIVGHEVSPDGARLATWDDYGWVTLWDTDTGHAVGEAFRMKSGVTYGAGKFSADSRRFAVWDTGGAQVVDAATGALVGGRLMEAGAKPDGGYLQAAAFAPGTHRLATSHTNGEVRLWDTETADLVAELELPRGPGRGWVKMSDDGQILYGWSGGAVYFWLTATGEPAGQALAVGEEIVHSQLAPDNSRIVTWGHTTEAVLWILGEGRASLSGCHGNQVTGAQFVPQSDRIITQASGGEVCLWRASDGAPVGERMYHQYSGNDFAISPDGARMFTGSYLAGPRLTLLATGEAIETPADDAGALRGTFSPDGRYLLTQTNSDVRLWLAHNYENAGLAQIDDGSGGGAVFSPDSRYVAVQDANGQLRIYDVVGGGTFSGALPHTDYMRPPRFLPGNRLLTVNMNTASIWKVEAWTTAGPKLPEWGFHYGSQMSPDGKRVLVWTEYGEAELWDTFAQAKLEGGLLVGEQGYWGAAFDTARPQMALWFEGAVQMVNTDTAEGSEKLMEHEGYVQDAFFMADGRRLLVTTGEGEAFLWNTETFENLGGVLAHPDAFPPAISPKGDRVAVWNEALVQLIDAETGKLVGLAMAHASHDPEDDAGAFVNGAVFSADGRILVTWNPGEMRSWTAADGSAFGPVIVPGGFVSDVALSPDGTHVVVVTGTDAVIYRTEDGTQAAPALTHVHDLFRTVFSGDGKTLLTMTQDYRGQLWDVRTGRAKGDPIPLGSDTGSAWFLEGDRRLVTWDHVGEQVIFDAATGTEVARNPQFDYFDRPLVDAERGVMQTLDTTGRVRLLDIDFALRTEAAPQDVADVCAAKLNGALSARGVPFVRELDGEAVFAAPILRGREGEDVCAPVVVPWWEQAAGAVFGWAFN